MTDIDKLTQTALDSDFELVSKQNKNKDEKSQFFNHVVFLVHGIRDNAEWQEVLRRKVDDTPFISAIPFKYGYFDVLRFLFFRSGPLARLTSDIKATFENNSISKISIIAHSFGTHLTSKTLSKLCKEPFFHKKIHRIILCGTIIKDEFDWEKICINSYGETKPNIINDCGIFDNWPIIAKSVAFGFGASGRFGFGRTNVLDRFHELDHGGFFDEQFIEKYWIPFITDGIQTYGLVDIPRTNRALSLLTIPIFQLKTIVLLWIPLVIFIWILF